MHPFFPSFVTLLLALFPCCSNASAQVSDPSEPSPDWLLFERPHAASITTVENTLVLSNGLARRAWRLDRNGACVAIDRLGDDREGNDPLGNNVSLLRAVRPEARIVVDGKSWDIGGLEGQPNHAYLLPKWVESMTVPKNAFRFVGWSEQPIEERMSWKRVRHASPLAVWPPPGRGLRLDFAPPKEAGLKGLLVSVHYELYDGIPLFAKQIRIVNKTGRTVELDRLTAEVLAVVEQASWVEGPPDGVFPKPQSLHVVTDYSFGGGQTETAQAHVVHWRVDPLYLTQVNYLRKTPCLLEVEPQRGPDVLIENGESFRGFHVFELLHDSSDRERRGLAIRAMYRVLAPWVTENPLILHVVSSDETIVKRGIDQAAECGFEALSFSFGSGLNMENESEENLEKYRKFAVYARKAGLHVGGYSLLASRRIKPEEDNAVHPETGTSFGHKFNYSPALASTWGKEYFRKVKKFFEETGFLQFTHDGSYPGDWDDAPRPPLQRGLDDSQWVQWQMITDLYRWMREIGVYMRVPDFYHLNGSNQQGMGYRETNWSLPRAQQVIHTRQNIFDGSWEMTPSMGWMFVPLTQYHGGGEAATIEPLSQHLDHYEIMLASNLGMGVQGTYRGLRLYDTEQVRDRVLHWTTWFKKYRDILESDMIHGRRADGRDVDWMLHVNPRLTTRGMLVVFNPLEKDATRTLTIPLYYTGLRDTAQVSVGDGEPTEHQLDRRYRIRLEVNVPAGKMRWFPIR